MDEEEETPRGGAEGGEGETAEGGGGEALGAILPRAGGEEELERAAPNKHRAAQRGRAPRRKLFNRAAREDFLGWYAASGNCRWAAERAGFCEGTVWRHRASDAGFREAFDEAAAQGIARAKVVMLEDRMRRAPYRIEAGREVPDFEVDPDIAMKLIREHDQGGPGGGRQRRGGRRPRVATNEEVRAALVKRLAAYSRRVKAQGGG